MAWTNGVGGLVIEGTGAMSGAEFDKVAIQDGKAYLGVSVYTNPEVVEADVS